jgi:hypothetical protein
MSRAEERVGKAARLTLLPHEVALLLQVPRSRVVELIERGELRNASRDRFRRIAIEDAGELIRCRVGAGECSPLASLLLEEMRRGRLRVSREEAGWLNLEGALGRRDLRRAV